MAFPFLGLFIIFLSVAAYYRKRATAQQKKVTEDFWSREDQANQIRRKDISNLPYITIPLEKFPIGISDDEELTDYENDLKTLASRKILNLSHQSNTDLKLAESSLLSLPKTVTVPSSARQRPRISLIAVLFPAPFFPINPSICPSGSSIDISKVKFPYVFRTFCIVIIQFPPFFFYFSSKISFTTSDISSFFIPMESARSITLSKSSSIAFCLASSASCLSEADTYVPFP